MGLSRRTLLLIAVLAGVYFVAGKLGLRLAFLHASATPVWPPTGITLAAFLIFGYRVWPGVLLGAFLVNVTTAGSVATSVGIAAGNTLEGVTGAYLVRRFAGGSEVFHKAGHIFRLAVFIAPVSTAVSATLGVTSLALGGFADWANYSSIWLTWWLGDMSGALVIAPLALVWTAAPHRPWNRALALESVALAVCLLLAGKLVFGGYFSPDLNNLSLEFVCTPFLIWAAFRLGRREAAAAILLLSGIAVRGTLLGHGPFVRISPNESLRLLQAFLGVSSVMTMAVAAVVADWKRAERAISELNQDLERRVAERTAELAASNAELEAFTYSVSHDLRAPARHMSGFAGFLLEDHGKALPPSAHDYLRRISEAGQRMGQMIDDLLGLSRLGRREPARHPTDLRLLVDEAVLDLREETGGREVRWEIGPLPVWECDPGLMKIVLANLLENAVKFSRTRAVAVIRIGQAGTGGEQAVLVADNGVGFDMKDAGRLFGVFSRLHPGDEFEGSGVGLATVQRIIHKHGGRIWVESAPDQGATFYFTIGRPEAAEHSSAGVSPVA